MSAALRSDILAKKEIYEGFWPLLMINNKETESYLNDEGVHL